MAAYTSPTNTSVGSFPTPNKTVTVQNVSGLPTGAASTDATTRQADMSIWDTTGSVFVRPEQTNQPVPNQ